MCGTPLHVLCVLLPVFEPVEQLVCLDIKDPQEVGLAMLLPLWLQYTGVRNMCTYT